MQEFLRGRVFEWKAMNDQSQTNLKVRLKMIISTRRSVKSALLSQEARHSVITTFPFSIPK